MTHKGWGNVGEVLGCLRKLKVVHGARGLWRWLVEALFPSYCPLCGISVGGPGQLCLSCENVLPSQPENYCLRCGQTTAHVVNGCGGCLHSEPLFDAVYFPFRYEKGMVDLIVRLKFADHTEYKNLLGWLCFERIGESLRWESPDMVVPVPLHPLRLIQRRYNQSALIAGDLARRLNRPLVTNVLRRIKVTRPQTRLAHQGRQQNVHNAFFADRGLFQGKSVLLVDDVFTSGATTRSAAKALRRAGVARVAVLCLARVENN